MNELANRVMGIAGLLIIASIFADLLFFAGVVLMAYASFITVKHLRLKKIQPNREISECLHQKKSQLSNS